MRTRILPTAIIVKRNDRPQDRHYTPQESSRLPVIVQPETAPKPIDDTSFFGVGRDPQHAWPHIWRYQALAIQDKLSIRSWEGAGDPLTVKVPSALVVGMARGHHIPVTERANIEAPSQTTYGALTAIAPDPTWAPQYAKLT